MTFPLHFHDAPQVPAAAFDAIRKELAPVERRLSLGIPCEVMATDGDTYEITWEREGTNSTLVVYFGCGSPVLEEIRAALGKAHGRVLQLEAGEPR